MNRSIAAVSTRPTLQRVRSAQSSTGAFTLRNLTGSVQIFPQIIQTKASVSLSAAATTAEKSVGLNSHATSAHIAIVNGYLVYRVHVIDTNNNIHRVIVTTIGNQTCRQLVLLRILKRGNKMCHDFMDICK
jgi:hypothetical protein